MNRGLFGTVVPKDSANPELAPTISSLAAGLVVPIPTLPDVTLTPLAKVVIPVDGIIDILSNPSVLLYM